jgi:uncharacterized protein (DUF1501 family)
MTKEIDRRSFLAGMLSLGAAGVVPKALGSADTRLRAQVAVAETKKVSAASDGTLVLLTLYGGNDGLNTVVPLNDPAYSSNRDALAISPDKALPLDADFGLNPSMPGLHAMWQAGQLAIVRGVGYPNPSLSHFQSMDIWQSASLSNDVGTGWLGRWLDHTGHDALQACSIGPTVLPAMAGGRRKAAALQDSTYPGSQLPDVNAHLLSLYQELQRPDHFASHLEASVAQSGADMLTVSHTAAKAMVLEPAPAYSEALGDLGTQLGVVSQLIRAGLPTSAFAVVQGGYDTHSGELSIQNALLKQLDAVLTEFLASIAATPRGKKTTVVIYSEFGRRVEGNGSGGTDHGTANNVLVLGPAVHGGFYGDPPSLTKLDEYGNLVHTVDFRAVYSTVLEGVLAFEPKLVLGRNYPSMGFV